MPGLCALGATSRGKDVARHIDLQHGRQVGLETRGDYSCKTRDKIFVLAVVIVVSSGSYE